MPDESELREVLRDAEGPAARIDLDAVLRRARARRRPRAVLAVAVGALALTAITVPVGLAITSPGGGVLTTAGDGSADQQAPVGAEIAPLTPPDAGRCGEPLPAGTATAHDLVVEVPGVEASASAERIPVTLTIRNTSDVRIRGTLGTPVLVLARDDIVVWHTPTEAGPAGSAGSPIDLAPGETIVLVAEFAPLVCTVTDDAEGFRDDLPAAGTGEYALSASVVFRPESGADDIVLAAPASRVVLG